MMVYRIANEPYRQDISGTGAALYGARWNSVGVYLLYTSQHISLSILESLVHLPKNIFPPSQYLLHIEFPDHSEMGEISLKKLKAGWQEQVAYTQWMGDQFIQHTKQLVLKVPSAVVPEEHNFLLNPLHADFKKVKIVRSELLQLDKRLIIHS